MAPQALQPPSYAPRREKPGPAPSERSGDGELHELAVKDNYGDGAGEHQPAANGGGAQGNEGAIEHCKTPLRWPKRHADIKARTLSRRCALAHMATARPAKGEIRDPTCSEPPGDDDFHDLVLQQNDNGGDDEHESSADGGGSPGNKEKHGSFLRACQGGMKAIKIENRTWRCARAHISSNNRR